LLLKKIARLVVGLIFISYSVVSLLSIAILILFGVIQLKLFVILRPTRYRRPTETRSSSGTPGALFVMLASILQSVEAQQAQQE
jgi:hypothetical protein